jgi:hypothetical protein
MDYEQGKFYERIEAKLDYIIGILNEDTTKSEEERKDEQIRENIRKKQNKPTETYEMD